MKEEGQTMEEHLQIRRKASDNEYFHRDFHMTLDLGIQYLGEHYGKESVTEYLAEFTEIYHAPLLEKIRKEGLNPLQDFIRETYASEHASDDCLMVLTETELQVEIVKCPVLQFFSEVGYEPSPWFYETTNTTNRTIAEQSGLLYIPGKYNPKSGHDTYRFQKRVEETT